MDHQITAEDLEFMRWLDRKEGEQYWEKDEKDEKGDPAFGLGEGTRRVPPN